MPRRRKQPGPTIVDGRVSYRLQGDALDYKVERTTFWPGAHPANADVYAPRDAQLVPKAGAWAMITRPLPLLERRLDEQVRPARVFWVEHHSENVDDEGFAPDGTYKVLCRSPFGELTLWPYEYTVMRPDFLTDAWARGEYVFHPMAADERQFNEALFYCLSRGIARADAVVMTLGAVTGPVGWFEPAPDLAAELEAFVRRFANVGMLTEENHARRRAARARVEAISRLTSGSGAL